MDVADFEEAKRIVYTSNGDVNVLGSVSIRFQVLHSLVEEIQHLRSLAGAVSQGPSFAETRKVLKAFDGA